MKSAVGVSALLIAFLMYVGSWGSYSLEVIPLKVGQWTHMGSAADMERLAQIGLDLKKLDLVEHEYKMLAQQVDPKNYVRLGKFQLNRMEYKEAAETYRQYFLLGKRDWEARFDYARALGEIGKIDEASKNFEYVLRARPGIRQVTVVQRYVNMLVKANRFDQAQRVIEHVRKQDPSASRFMDTEYKVIAERKNSRS
ncbi:MAG: tetratricopeptide repeat protein [Bdellovibrionales bacterium]